MSGKEKECQFPQLQSASCLESTCKQFSKINLLINNDFGFMKELEVVLNKSGQKEDNIFEIMQIFDRFISGFKTYKPFLQSIKEIIEKTVLNLKQDIAQISLDQQSWRLLAEQNENKLMVLKQEHSKETGTLKKEIQNLKKLCSNFILVRSSHEKQIQKLSDELAQVYESYLEERSGRKLLVAEVVKLEKKHGDEMMKLQKQFARRMEEISGGDVDDFETNDPVLLKILLKKSKANEEIALKKLNDLRMSYDDDVSKHDHEGIGREKLVV